MATAAERERARERAADGVATKAEVWCGARHTWNPLAKPVTRLSTLCGTRYAYNRGCRCDECRKAEAVYKRAQRAAWGAQGRAPRGVPNHGTKHCYDAYKCRCDECREAKVAYMREYRARRDGNG